MNINLTGEPAIKDGEPVGTESVAALSTSRTGRKINDEIRADILETLGEGSREESGIFYGPEGEVADGTVVLQISGRIAEFTQGALKYVLDGEEAFDTSVPPLRY